MSVFHSSLDSCGIRKATGWQVAEMSSLLSSAHQFATQPVPLREAVEKPAQTRGLKKDPVSLSSTRLRVRKNDVNANMACTVLPFQTIWWILNSCQRRTQSRRVLLYWSLQRGVFITKRGKRGNPPLFTHRLLCSTPFGPRRAMHGFASNSGSSVRLTRMVSPDKSGTRAPFNPFESVEVSQAWLG